MQRLCASGIVAVVFLFISHTLMAQDLGGPIVKVIKPLELDISYNKTTNLIFPYAIKSVDRGSAAVLAQIAKGVENILQVKAGRQGFEPTNLSVVTADGAFYSFLLDYAYDPLQLSFSFQKDNDSPDARFAGGLDDAATLEKEACKVLSERRFLHVRTGEQLMRLSLQGVLLSEDRMWLKLALQNGSHIAFKPNYVRFFLRDKKRVKRTAIQETELQPAYSNAAEAIDGERTGIWTVAFPAFTVPRHQYLVIQVGEQAGGRTLTLRIKSRTILKARQLAQ